MKNFKSKQMLRIRRSLRILGQVRYLVNYYYVAREIDMEVKDAGVLYTLNDDQINDLIESFYNVRFDTNFPIYTLRDKKIIIISAKKFTCIKQNDAYVIIVPHPLIFLIVHKIKIIGIRESLKKLLLPGKKLNLNNNVLYQTFITRILNNYENLDIFTTISGVKSYPIEFYIPRISRRYATHVIHYSQNSVEIKFEDEKIMPKNSLVDVESLGDIHWVWTQSYADYLQTFNSFIDFKAVGSITFKNPRKRLEVEKSDIITIFDVTPFTNYNQKMFYSDELLKKFISEIVFVKQDIETLKNFKIQIKSKRLFNKNLHSVDYINYLENLHNSNKVRIIPWDRNPYDLVAESKLIISIPFTSIAYIGKEVGTNTVFYYPYLRELCNPVYLGLIDIVYGEKQLRKYFIDNIK
jgi:polysaccharide biosynthesis PFTS motif protein